MSELKNPTWIVLIQKVPHGPFTEVEVKTLMDNKIIRPNDIAYLIPEPPETHSQWKFLWQFPVFDRRLNMKPTEGLPKTVELSAAEAKAIADRRANAPKEDLTKKLQDSLPADLSQISVEELMYKTKNLSPSPARELTQEAQRDNLDKEFSDNDYSPPSTGNGRWIGAALGLAVVVGMVWMLTGTKPKTVTEAPKQVVPEVKREVTESKAPQGSPLDFGVTPRPQTKRVETAAAAPVARDPEPIRDRGEIPSPTADREGAIEFAEGAPENDGVPDELLPPNHPGLRKGKAKKKKRAVAAEPPEEVNEPPAEEAAAEGAEEEPLD